MKKLHSACFAAAALMFSSGAFAQETPGQEGVKIEQLPPPEQQPPPPTTTPQQPAPAPDQKDLNQPPKKGTPISVRVDGGYGIRSLEKLEVKGADLGLAIGAQPAKHFAVYGALRGFFGSTAEGGLGVKALRATVDMDIVISRFRIGFDPGLFWVGVDRVTQDQTIVGWGPKIGMSFRFDVLQEEPFLVFLRAAADAGATFSDGSMFGGVVFGAGLDFDIKPGNRE